MTARDLMVKVAMMVMTLMATGEAGAVTCTETENNEGVCRQQEPKTKQAKAVHE